MHMLKLVSRIFRLLVAAFILGNLVYVFIDNILRDPNVVAARPNKNYRSATMMFSYIQRAPSGWRASSALAKVLSNIEGALVMSIENQEGILMSIENQEAS
jgi:hypothetical protein